MPQPHARWAGRALGAVTVVAALLAGCEGPPAPAGSAESVAAPEVVVPTRGSDAQEAPLPRGQALPVLTTAVGGNGSGTLVAPDAVCVFWTWGGDGSPDLVDGLAFHVDHAIVDPQTWVVSDGACPDVSVPWCADAQITVDGSTCQVGFVRAGLPEEHAFVGMVGTLRCAVPLTQDDCVTLASEVDAAPDVSPGLDLEAVVGGGG